MESWKAAWDRLVGASFFEWAWFNHHLDKLWVKQEPTSKKYQNQNTDNNNNNNNNNQERLEPPPSKRDL